MLRRDSETFHGGSRSFRVVLGGFKDILEETVLRFQGRSSRFQRHFREFQGLHCRKSLFYPICIGYSANMGLCVSTRFRGATGDFRGIPDHFSGFPGVSWVFQGFGGIPGVSEAFQGVSGDFTSFQENSEVFQEVSRVFLWILGALQEFSRAFRVVSGGFRPFQGCSGGFKTFQEYSSGSLGVSSPFSRVPAMFQRYQNITEAFQEISGDFRSVPGCFQRFQGVPEDIRGVPWML